MAYKFAFDLGSSSCGWAVVEVDENQNVLCLKDMGVRIFPDGRNDKNPESLCVNRRNKRELRRRFDRILLRKKRLLGILKSNNMADFHLDNNKNSEDFIQNNPYYLRAKAVYEKVSLSELGHIFFNLCQRRGFKSNRKEIKQDKKNDEGLQSAIKRLSLLLSNKTLGEYLYETYCDYCNNKDEKNNVDKIRFSEQFDKNKKLKNDALYPTREMYESEFEKIWDVQSRFYPSVLKDDLKKELYDAIFYQRNLHPQERGKCIFESGEYRIYKAHPLFQKFRILQTINQLKVIDNSGKLKPFEQRDKLKNILFNSFDKANKKGEITWGNLKKLLGVDKLFHFNLETEKRMSLSVDTTAFILSKEDYFGDKWFELSDIEKSEIVDDLLSDKSDEDVKLSLLKYNLSNLQIDNILTAPLEDNVGSLSLKAILKLIPLLEKGYLYNDACREIYKTHSDLYSEEKMEKLPYYGQILRTSCISVKEGDGSLDEQKYGRITNVTVHIALNQLRQVVNSLIEKYGKPNFISIEVARDLKAGTKQRKEIMQRQKENEKYNNTIVDFLNEHNFKVNRENIQKYKLWKELSDNPTDRCCVYTGRPISETDLFSPNVQIEHILPFSRTLDDSMANKTLSYSDANYYKKERTPFEAFANSKDSRFVWHDIVDRALKLPANKSWRFEENAMDKFKKDNDFIARVLNDTRYMSRIAVLYLKCLFDKEHKSNVFGLPGSMTSLLREAWGLNVLKDKRNDDTYRALHIHHAIDAFVIACMTRSQMQILAKNADKIEKEAIDASGQINYSDQKEWRKKLVGDKKDPIDNFDRDGFFRKCENIVVSYKSKLKNPKNTKNTVGALHEDTAYNLLDFKRNKKGELTSQTKAIFECRVLISDLKEKDLVNVHDSYAEKLVRNNDQNLLGEFLEYCKACGKKKIRVKKEVDFSNYVPVFRSKQERDAYHLAYENWYKETGKGNKVKEKALMKVLCDEAKKAYKWYVSGNNFCADIYQIDPNDKVFVKERGQYNVEIISNYMAMLNKGEPLWKKKYPKARRIIRLKQDDQIMLEFDGCKYIYRVRGFGLNKQFFLRHNKDTKDTNRSLSPCINDLIKMKIRKIYVSPIGDVIDNGFDTKWSNKDDK